MREAPALAHLGGRGPPGGEPGVSGPVGVDAFEHGGEVAAREAPVEGPLRRVAVVFGTIESILEGGEVGTVAGERLELGLLIGRDHVVVGVDALPWADRAARKHRYMSWNYR